jgi:hypothetical protein
MKARAIGLFGLACSLALASVSGSAEEAKLTYSNKWRIEISESAKSDGNLLFRLTPKEGTATDVSVAIKDGRSENHVATDVRDAFKAALDAKAYKVEKDDGEDVLVKKHSGSKDFSLVLVESTVKAVRVNIEKE